MKKEEIMVAIQQLKDIAGNLQCQIAALEELVVNENPVEETPVITIVEEKEELPAPPEVIYIDIPEEKPKTTPKAKKQKEAPDEEAMLGCQIINILPEFYRGTCSVLRLHKRYFDNGQPKLYIDKYHVVIIALDNKMQEIGRTVTHWNNLAKFHAELSKRGINTHTGENWMPRVINLDLD